MVTRVVEVVDPDPSWPQTFAVEADRLRRGLESAGVSDRVVAIEHIGSTAVPDLAAKPVIDLLLGLRHWPAPPALIAALEELGYVHRGEAGIVGRNYLQDAPPGAPRTRQLHLVEHGGRIWRDQLRFRDHLRAHPADRTAYGHLKRDLARAHRLDVLAYTDAKRVFIRGVLDRVRAGQGEASVHEVAQQGFGTDPKRYERARPGYPPEAVEWVAARLGLDETTRVADVGAGTGKLTRALVATGARVLAVEPVAAMRAHLSEALPGIEVVDGTAEDLPVSYGALDVLAAGQAFHWFDAEAALSEAHRVLRDGGALALLWNSHDESVPWVAAWTRFTTRFRGPAPDRRTGQWRKVLQLTELFDGPDTEVFDNPHVVSRDQLVDRVASSSFIASLPGPDRQRALADFRDLLEEHPETRGRDELTVPYRTEVHVIFRVP